MQLSFLIFQDLSALLNAISAMTNAVEPSIWWRWRAAPRGKGPSQSISHLLHFLSLPGPSPIALCGGPGKRDMIVCPPSPEGTSCFPKHLRVLPVARLHVWQCPQLAALPILQEQLSFDRAPCHPSPAACPLGDFRLLNPSRKWGTDYFSLLSLALTILCCSSLLSLTALQVASFCTRIS